MDSVFVDGTSKNKIYRELRRTIIMGHRKAGERLDIDQLCRQYDTSITPVRDALQMLSQEGLITIRPRSGYFVTRISLKELRDMLEMREILELAVFERAAARITPDQLAALRHVHAGYTGDDDESYDRYTDENRRFHYLLAQASGNHELAETLGHLHDRLARYMVMRHAGQTQEDGHQKILDALQDKDLSAARALLLSEIRSSREAILERVYQEEAANWLLEAALPSQR
jgi:DNA-binding GntR family transcriptional regulator